ncbi:MAG: hypothetical protein EA428_00740 [Spirochaetaceae bacterium]|nr:MAG: hypothetical protein EA428_00740 [Spirochaetaceae bacterium]
MKTITIVSMLLFIALSSSAQEGGVDGSVRLTNTSTSGWRMDQVEGDGISVTGVHQGRILLAVGGRYHFDLSETDSEHMPLVIRGFRATTYPAMHVFIATYDPEAIAEQQAEAAAELEQEEEPTIEGEED